MCLSHVACTNIDIDEALTRRAMRRYHPATKREAVHFALTRVAGDAVSREEATATEGAGWEGDLDARCGGRIEPL